MPYYHKVLIIINLVYSFVNWVFKLILRLVFKHSNLKSHKAFFNKA